MERAVTKIQVTVLLVILLVGAVGGIYVALKLIPAPTPSPSPTPTPTARAASKDPFDLWFIDEMKKNTGVDFSQPPAGPMPEMLISFHKPII